MASEPLPDHYKALGIDKTADSAAIKSTYRKLVLKFHPDKVTDPAQKEAATDRFHQIQQAYETLTGSTSRSTRPDKESPRSARPAANDRTRSDREKTRAKETRDNRKFNSVDSESSADEKARYEADYKRRSEEDTARKQAAESRRKAEDRRSYEDTRYAPSSARKLSVQEEEAIRYQHKSRGQVEAEMTRPPYHRTSSRDAYGPEHRSSRRPDVRPEAPRRSSARPKERTERTVSSSGRGMPEIVDWGDDRRVPPVFKHSSSSPANIEVPRSIPQRSYTTTEAPRESRRSDKSPPATLLRSATMPANHSAPRQKAPTAARPSGLREQMTSEHRSPEHDAFPSVPPPQPSSSSKKYYYTTSGGGGVTLRPEDIPGSASKPRTILREPGRHHQRSPSPLSRPPIGPNRPSETSTATYTTKPASAVRPPPMDRTTSSRNISPVRNSEDRGRSSRKLYGEVNSSSADPRRARQASYSPSEVQYTRKYGPEDVRWAPRGRENERDYPASKPTLGRTATYAY
ncbi:DnaJ-domain-containing protein [Plenodomus tracheiphilus IPT5]|uniref:DnaJ-domain-containing protein n=1 Tax=Plenodomus tracheiphilus IPT5 TaxID=1408161 RepID=A0A6A7BF88_9PLEO|nr:DnaJ-domain-containing protein [Plenodomus tracheiphilus IPT5]